MFDLLIAAVVGALTAVSSPVPAAVREAPAVEVVEDAAPVEEPATWYDYTTGVYVSAETWQPDIGSYPTGAELGDICVPDERYPGFGTTKVGAIPCTP